MNYSQEFIDAFNNCINTDEANYLLKGKPEILGKILYDNIVFNLVTKDDIDKLTDLDANHFLYRELKRKVILQTDAINLYQLWRKELENNNKIGSKSLK